DMSTELYSATYYDKSTGTDSFTMGLKAGTYYVKVANWTGAVGKTYTLRVDRALARASISTKAAATYTGKSLKPSIKVKAGGVTLKKNRDYTLSYKNNKKVGVATVTIKGKGQYAGATRTCTFKIVPKGTAVKSVKAGKKSFTVKWKKQSKQTAGYQIRYSTSKSMKGAKTLTVSGAKKTTAKIKKLKAKKTYYVQVRTYKQVGGKNYCSEWSQKQKVKTQ
ncbi:fibronectin type III domain-containing protein, partial [uncultured Adlercreutzia sp.]|uniref:fibronectin type III domain-containing protein n=3 Tax=uncultured Adlercreutzia sp. TaxID=875803 RepID=UPI00272EA242